MRRKIAILLVLAMLFALAGCGQQTSKTKTQESASTEEQLEQTAAQEGPTQDEQNDDTEDLFGYDFDTDDGIDNSSSNASVSGIKNADGTYTHNVDGYELTLKTNLSDYIKYENVFYYKQLATDLGWHPPKMERPDNTDLDSFFWDVDNPNWSTYRWGDGDSCEIYINDTNAYGIGYTYGDSTRKVNFQRYDKEDPDIISYQVNPNGTNDINYEQIVVMTYLLENLPNNPNEDPFDEIQDSVSGYWTVYK